MGYSGKFVSVRRDLDANKVVVAWPKVGEACVCSILNFIDEHLRDDLLDPQRCLLPEVEWPSETPRIKLDATDSQWYAICKAAVARNMLCGVR